MFIIAARLQQGQRGYDFYAQTTILPTIHNIIGALFETATPIIPHTPVMHFLPKIHQPLQRCK